ncbi:bifunctional diaminohydroxyphosphoribosylaminopyrimidine deaminase/5-amino-6-(5-phosphoribosylamino)uracil reductase RibD [Leuconostoc citreum]
MDDLTYMALAAKVAAKAGPDETYENPRVGAIIVKNGRVLATGYHHSFGAAHAEINAFENLRDQTDIVDSTMYVTLEPCFVTGKVGACALAIAQWGVKRVVVGSFDPNPDTHGRSVTFLRQAGIRVDVLGTEDSQILNPAFYHYFERHLPYVQLKLAESANHFVASSQGQSTKITNQLADIDVHKERASKSAILIGSETMLIDQPNLTVRHVPINQPQPLRVVIDRRGRLQNKMDRATNNWLIFTTNTDFAKQYDNVLLMSHGLLSVLTSLASKNIQSVMVEGGPSLITAFLKANLWQEFIVYTADSILSEDGVPSVQPLFNSVSSYRVGNTLKSRYLNDRSVSCLQE